MNFSVTQGKVFPQPLRAFQKQTAHNYQPLFLESEIQALVLTASSLVIDLGPVSTCVPEKLHVINTFAF